MQTRHSRIGVVSLAATALLTGCFAVTDYDKDKIQTEEKESFLLQYRSESLVNGFDVLLVVDISGNVNEVSAGVREAGSALGAMMQPLIENVDSFDAPMFHIGLITSDLGAGGHDVTHCDGEGDDALLQARVGQGCPLMEDRFLQIRNDEAINYTKDGDSMPVGEAVDCLIRGQTERDPGCGFEQPIRAAVESLQRAENEPFFREDAGLAILFVTTEDDCSASDPSLFDPNATEELGQLHSFRCVRFGITCDEPLDQVGEKHGCRPNPDGTYLYTIEQLAEQLTAQKPASRIVVGTVAGPPEPVFVEEGIAGLSVGESCTGSTTSGRPGVRLEAFRQRFSADGLHSPVCMPEMAEFLYKISDELAAQAAVRCIPRTPSDQDLTTPELEAACDVWDVVNLDQTNEQKSEPFPTCEEPDAGYPCYRIRAESLCSSGYEMDVLRDTPPPADSQVLAECVVEIE